MKLVDILVEELPKRGGWPDDSDEMCQSQFDCEIYTNSRLLPDFYVGERAEDNGIDNGVTREQYEAALAAKNGGWIEWGGGECPVADFLKVEYQLRGGAKGSESAKILEWQHEGGRHDIIAYRLHQPQEAEQAKSELNDCVEQDAAPDWNGEGAIPPVGCVCERSWAGSDLMPCKILFVTEQLVVVKLKESGREDAYNIGDVIFRQIRTEAERKREDVRKAIYAAMNIIDGDIADAIYDAIAAGKIPGVKLEDL